jgi:glycyl-tRNA synthetase alpha subunit
LLVGDIKQGGTRTMTGTVDEYVNAPIVLDGAICHCLECLGGLIAAGQADTAQLFKQFEEAEAECKKLLAYSNERSAALTLPAYDQCIKASHRFNLLDARGVIGVTERASYIGRVRALAKACCEAWMASGQGAYESRRV